MHDYNFNGIPKFRDTKAKKIPTNLREKVDVVGMKIENEEKVFSNPKIKNVLKELAYE